MQSNDVKLNVLQDLMDKMRQMDGEKIRPKPVAVAIEAKPETESDEGTPEEEAHDVMEGKSDDIAPEHSQHGDGEELSPEDLEILEQLFSGHDKHEA